MAGGRKAVIKDLVRTGQARATLTSITLLRLVVCPSGQAFDGDLSFVNQYVDSFTQTLEARTYLYPLLDRALRLESVGLGILVTVAPVKYTCRQLDDPQRK